MASEQTVILNSANFEAEVLKSNVPVLVDFWADWCAPCKMLAPLLDEVATEKASVAKVAKLNVQEHQDVAAKYGVQYLPTLLFFKNGEVVDKIVGAGVGKKALADKLQGLV